MKWFTKKLDIFCYKHPRFGISNLMLYVVIGNAIVWLFSMMDTTNTLYNLLCFSPYHILHGQVWRLITFALIPNSSGILTVIFLYFYYFIGKTLEDRWGTPRFTLYFFSGIILTVIYGFVLYFTTGINYPVYADYIYLSMFFSFAAMFPDMQVLLFFIIPIKMKWLAIIDALYFIMAIVQTPFPLSLLPLVAVLNFFLFCGDTLIGYFRHRGRRKKGAVNFKREVHRIQYEQKTKPYTRRCEVCGRTDSDHPDLEFRYCSRCQGYHCFCIDHINSHQHFSE